MAKKNNEQCPVAKKDNVLGSIEFWGKLKRGAKDKTAKASKGQTYSHCMACGRIQTSSRS